MSVDNIPKQATLLLEALTFYAHTGDVTCVLAPMAKLLAISNSLTGESPLFVALNSKQEEVALHFVRLMSAEDLNVPDNNLGNTALMVAAENGMVAVVEYLVSKNVDISTRNCLGENVFHVAEPSCLKSLGTYVHTEQTKDKAYEIINCINLNGKTPLLKAAIMTYHNNSDDFDNNNNNNSFGLMKALIYDVKVDVCAADVLSGDTVLHICSRSNNILTVSLLLKFGKEHKLDLCNINNNVFETPMHVAMRRNCYGIVEMLMKSGAEFDSPNLNGQTAFELGHVYNSVEAVGMLFKSVGVDPDFFMDAESKRKVEEINNYMTILSIGRNSFNTINNSSTSRIIEHIDNQGEVGSGGNQPNIAKKSCSFVKRFTKKFGPRSNITASITTPAGDVDLDDREEDDWQLLDSNSLAENETEKYWNFNQKSNAIAPVKSLGKMLMKVKEKGGLGSASGPQQMIIQPQLPMQQQQQHSGPTHDEKLPAYQFEVVSSTEKLPAYKIEITPTGNQKQQIKHSGSTPNEKFHKHQMHVAGSGLQQHTNNGISNKLRKNNMLDSFLDNTNNIEYATEGLDTNQLD